VGADGKNDPVKSEINHFAAPGKVFIADIPAK
jgi:hypothetical protein